MDGLIDWLIDLYYRFYSHNSSFIHSGMEQPGEEQSVVVGQAVSMLCYCFMSYAFFSALNE